MGQKGLARTQNARKKLYGKKKKGKEEIATESMRKVQAAKGKEK